MLPLEAILAPPSPTPPPGRRIGRSREGREIVAHRFGQGPLRLSLIAGCHSDEPVGPAMLRRLVAFLAALPADDPLLASFTWSVVPHVNPDGEEKNRAWSEVTVDAVDSRGEPDRAFDLAAYAGTTFRELPGDDMEFGFPRGTDDASARPENRAVAAFLAETAPLHLHASFHGMFFATGPWFLIEPAWIDRSLQLRENLRRRVEEMGYRVYDVDRGGEKGFARVDRGFTTRPDSRAMVAYFLERGDPETAAKFRPSSMEYARSLGGDPFTMVSEMPLFLTPPAAGNGPDTFGDPALRLDLARLARTAGPEAVRAEAERRGLRGMPLRDQMRLQLAFLAEALVLVSGDGNR
ncbi:MAG TPA: M14 family zinc carboxypeptidase [Thermoanaerobaculia bacterium]|nr:M14 family zinc carboxypeptidase [Thermoanaerobaculia bacterium]